MRTFFVLFLLTFSFFLHAQEAIVTWGEDIRTSRTDRYISIVGIDDTAFYAAKNLSRNNPDFVLESYNRASLNRTSSKSMMLPQVSDRDMTFEDIYYIDEKLYLFTSLYNTDQDQRDLFCTLLKPGGEWLDLPVKLDALKTKRFNAASQKVIFSQDSSMFMVYHELPYNRNSSESFSFRVYRKDLSLVWEKQLELPYGEEAFDITSHHLDNDGNVIMLAGADQKKVKNDLLWKQMRKKKYVLFFYDWKANKVSEFDVSLKDKWIISVASELAPNGDISVGGFYSNDQYFTVAGTFFFTLDKTSHNVKAKGLMAFEKSFLEQFMNERRVEKGRELPNFFFDHMILHEDGSAVMVAEQFDVTERTTNDPATGRQIVTNFYNYEDIMVIDVNADGSIGWARRIPKEQSTTSDLRKYSSYILIELGESVHILFNDHPGNIALLKNDPKSNLYPFNNVKKSVAILCSIDETGLVRRKELFSNKDAETILRPELFFQENDEVIVYGQYRRDYRFGKISIQPTN